MTKLAQQVALGVLAFAGLLMLLAVHLPRSIPGAFADLRSAPVWYDSNAVGTAPDWHYRVAIQVPAGATINSTMRVDVNFATVLSSLGVIGTLDVNSPRVVRPNNALAARQEFTDSIFGGATDALNNNQGEVRFILEDAGPSTYYLYFDITANGTKPANPQVPINGNFEKGGSGIVNAPGWDAPTVTAGFDSQIRPAETVAITAAPASVDGTQTRNTNGNPFTGNFSYLMGLRSVATQIAGNPGVVLTRSFTVPASASGNLSFRWKAMGWDSQTYDYARVEIVDGAAVTELIGPTYGNYASAPFSPNAGPAGQIASTTQPGYRQYNGFDCNLANTHTQGMTVLCRDDSQWWARTVSLAPWAGKTIQLRIRVFTDTADRSWWHFDDFEWSLVNATLGAAQAFGANIILPTSTTVYVPGQTMKITVNVDAAPAAGQMTADIYNNLGAVVASGVRLYDDGTHGDASANDGQWTNDGSVPADPTYQIPPSTANSSGWTVRVFARDSSTSSLGSASNGLARIPAAALPLTQANFFNIDEQTFGVAGYQLRLTKLSVVVSDPSNGTTNPKSIPGAVHEYRILVRNEGAASPDVNSIRLADPIPANFELFVGDIGPPGSGPVQFINGTPVSGLTYSFVSLASLTDDLEFSKDGGLTWSPTIVNTGGYDAAVTHIRINPKGTMAAASGAGNPSFELRFRARLK